MVQPDQTNAPADKDLEPSPEHRASPKSSKTDKNTHPAWFVTGGLVLALTPQICRAVEAVYDMVHHLFK